MRNRDYHLAPLAKRLSITFAAIILAIIAGAFNIASLALPSLASAPTSHITLLDGIRFESSFDDDDVAFLSVTLLFLRDRAPSWYTYVVDAEPLALAVDLSKGERGIAATSKCCDQDGYGLITFGAHLDSLYDEAADKTGGFRQIAFLSTLVHEVTHIHDRRSGRIPAGIGFTDCVSTERLAFGNEVEFKRALLATLSSALTINDDESKWLLKQIDAEASALQDSALNLYCLDLLTRPE